MELSENTRKKKVELLSPAGCYEAFQAALNAGADAVYLAGKRFGARAYAGNFEDDELLRCIREAHLSGVKVNLTVNTLMRESELSEMTEFLAPLAEAGLDAVIVQDLGAVKLIRSGFPDIAVHASTQMSVTTADSVRFLASLGVVRTVPARELSLEEIRVLKSTIPMEIETFIHGAMCYAYSGKCLFSSFLGGRSGNRGRCAQPCRLPYRCLDRNGTLFGTDRGKPEYYPLSMRDLCMIDRIPELIEAGIDSFKIEGRMKKPEYVAGVTEIYRKYIDLYYSLASRGEEKNYKVSDSDRKILESLYLRSERSEGYYYRKNGRVLLTIDKPGYTGADEDAFASLRSRYVHSVRKRELNGKIRTVPGEKLKYELSTVGLSGREIRIETEGQEVQQALRTPMSEADILKKAARFGDTVFGTGQITVEMQGEVFVPVRALGDLRRDALGKLEELLIEEYNNSNIAEYREQLKKVLKCSKQVGTQGHYAAFPSGKNGRLLISCVLSATQADASREKGADMIIDDSGEFLFQGDDVLLAFPYAVRKISERFMEEALGKLQQRVYCGAFVRNLEALEFLRGSGYKGPILADSSLYIWNTQSRSVLRRMIQGNVYPLELSGDELQNVFDRSDFNAQAADPYLDALFVYGRVPMMVSAGCIKKTENQCGSREDGFCFLKDRKNEVFPVRTICRQCQNIVFNSVPVSLHRAGADRIMKNCGAYFLSFTDENASDTADITDYFRKLIDGNHPDIGNSQFPKYTNGHYRKGAD